jgi:hypothetical protein
LNGTTITGGTVKKNPQGEPKGAENPDARQRNPQKPNEDEQKEEGQNREEGMDKTLADSFPASDPPSSIPDPTDEEDAA